MEESISQNFSTIQNIPCKNTSTNASTCQTNLLECIEQVVGDLEGLGLLLEEPWLVQSVDMIREKVLDT
jgi:hypothetical protein